MVAESIGKSLLRHFHLDFTPFAIVGRAAELTFYLCTHICAYRSLNTGEPAVCFTATSTTTTTRRRGSPPSSYEELYKFKTDTHTHTRPANGRREGRIREEFSGEARVFRDILRRRMRKNTIQRARYRIAAVQYVCLRIICPGLCEFPKSAVRAGVPRVRGRSSSFFRVLPRQGNTAKGAG